MNSVHRANTLLMAVALLLILPIVSRADEPPAAHWSYGGAESPSHWGNLDRAFAACGHGREQSPIDITEAKIADLPALEPHYKATSLNIINNGHSIQVNVSPGSTLAVGGRTYALKQFHFHHPSEVHVKGMGFPLEAHLVYQDADGHLAVVAVLFEQGKANALIDSLWHNIPAQKGVALDVPSVSVQVQELLPEQLGYFTFEGSLTTPPCTEGVAWYVLKSHPTISAQQIATFAKIYPRDARPIQASNGRNILQTK